MKAQEIGFLDFFSQIPDHRLNRRKLHPVEEIWLFRNSRGLENCVKLTQLKF